MVNPITLELFILSVLPKPLQQKGPLCLFARVQESLCTHAHVCSGILALWHGMTVCMPIMSCIMYMHMYIHIHIQ